jgi:glycosyltransferase involved in cell wall biosynthesis
MRVVHLMASPFHGGPERQMLGLAQHLPAEVQSTFLSFPERGLARAFIQEVQRCGLEGRLLTNNAPWFPGCIAEIAGELTRLRADVLCCSGYKPDLIGWRAARRVGIPVVSVSHGWTAATWKVRCYEALDRWALRWMDGVVCVSQAQAEKVRRAGVADAKIVMIRNAIGEESFVEAHPAGRSELMSWFEKPVRWLVGAAGRLSPEKGYAVFVAAAARVVQKEPEVGFVLFGDGPLRQDLTRLVTEHGLQGRFVLAGFRNDLRSLLPNLDLGVMSSFTEGLPVVLLEMAAAGVPTVAAAVGGIPEVIDEGRTGYLVPPNDPDALARRIEELLLDLPKRSTMAEAARLRVRREFSFDAMAQQYHDLFRKLTRQPHAPQPAGSPERTP